MVALAREQAAEGAHVLDLMVDYVGREGAPDMERYARALRTQATLPLVFDSTEVPVIETALKLYGGKGIVNSINLEDGERKITRLLPLIKRFGAAAVALVIDEEGQARTVDWKLRVAHRIHDLAVGRYGMESGDLLFDMLTFPLGGGQEDLRGDAMATLEAIRRVKTELPGTHTILGVSNVSFGLKPAVRRVLNSVFLAEAVEAGLDAAIVNARQIRPLSRIPEEQIETARDLIYDRRREDYDPLIHFLSLFEDEQAKPKPAEERAALPVEERLKQRIIDGDRRGLDADLDEALGEMEALTIINEHLLDGMKVVGELFGSGKMQLPFVLQSAETMKAAVSHLEPHMDQVEGSGKGRIVLATVRGDVHDIGKNLVDIILSNNGYTVDNLGIKQPIATIIEKALEVEADAIGLSGLLVKSTVVMREDLEELNARGLSRFPVLLGGAALNRRYVEHDLRAVYEGDVYYCKDAFEGLDTLGRVVAGEGPGPSRTARAYGARSRVEFRLIGAGGVRALGGGARRCGAAAALLGEPGGAGRPPAGRVPVRERDRALPGAVGLPAGRSGGGGLRGLPGRGGAARLPGLAGARNQRGAADAAGGLRLLQVPGGGERPARLARGGRGAASGPARALPVPAAASGAAALHRRLLPRRRERRVRHGGVHARDGGAAGNGAGAGAVRVERVPRLSALPRLRRGERGSAGGVLAQARAPGAGHRGTGRDGYPEAVRAGVPGVALLVRVSRPAPTWSSRLASRNCSAPNGSG